MEMMGLMRATKSRSHTCNDEMAAGRSAGETGKRKQKI